jgi:hypothetical protein
MSYRRGLAVSILLLFCLAASGKDKKKVLLPVDILRARTVWVMVDPDAGVDVRDPNANRVAQQNVENALNAWGRLRPVTDATTADLIIVIRKGNGKIAEPTIGGTPINSPPPVIAQRSDGGLNGAARSGPTGMPGDPSNAGSQSGPHPQMEVGSWQDMFSVYRSGPYQPLDSPPVWRYNAKNALQGPSVPAVERFRKVIIEAEKQLSANP